MKHVPGEPKPYDRRYLPVIFVPDNCSSGFAVIKNLDRYFAEDIFNRGVYFTQLRKRIRFDDFS